LSSSPSQLLSAVRAANETLVPSLLEQHALLLNVCDSHGVSPLIAAAGLSNPELSQKFTALLLQAGADDSLCDNSGRTAWHWAAIAGHASTVATLASFRARKAVQPQVLLAQDPDCSLENLTGPALQCVKAACEQIDKSMRTAFHWACIFGREACLKLLKFFSHPFVPSDVLAGVGHATLDDGRPCEERQGRKIVFSAVPNLRTLVLHHPDCKRHGDVTHQESPRRLDDIQRELKRTLHENEEFCVTTDFGKANYRHLTLVHSEDYIRTVGALNGLIKNVQDEEAAVSVPFTPYIQKKCERCVPDNQKPR